MEKRFYVLCQQVVEKLGLGLYDLEYLPGSGELRVYISTPDPKGVKIEDCVRVDEAMTPFIDSLDWMPKKLTLEVSSPGLYRNLRDRSHFAKAVGEIVLLSLAKSFSYEKLKNIKKVRGLLLACHDDSIEVQMKEKGASGNVEIPFENIKKANVDPDFNELMSQKISKEVKL